MTTLSADLFVVCHGAGGSGWEWHRVAAELARRGHRLVAVDMPCDDEDAGLADCADVVIDSVRSDATVEAAAGTAGPDGLVTVIGHSWGAFVAPLVADRLGAHQLVLVAPMIPLPGESAGAWWDASGFTPAEGVDFEDELTLFLHDLDPDLAAQALARSRDQAASMMTERFPLPAWPDIPTAVVAFGDDRLFSPSFVRGLARERLGVEAAQTPGGHCGYLSRPVELVDTLLTLTGGS